MCLERGVVISDIFEPIYKVTSTKEPSNHIEGLISYRNKLQIPPRETVFESKEIDGLSFKGNLRSSDIIKYLVYWDKIDYPVNTQCFMGLADPELIMLEAQGILTRTMYPFDNDGINPDLFLKSQLWALEQHIKSSKGQWTLAQDILETDDLYFPLINEDNKKQIIEFNLINSLPVPIDSTPIHEILDFKYRRRDELIKLREHLDTIYNSIIQSEELQKTYHKKIQEIQKDLYDLNRLFNENKIRTRLDSMKAHFQNILPTDKYSLFATPPTIASIAKEIPLLAPYIPDIDIQLAAGAMLAFSAKWLKSPAITQSVANSPFAYTFKMGREFKINP
ncbi:hypothetical protein HMPREF2753_06915 [Neisseria sp. HMSC071C03]|jgi:hypothetical protein|uniref:DUF6236 family protein n=1 Tax=Neisseria sicca TaxID=490 RepID=UPI0008A88128|nr:DUF6236 family protein [Neisseria sicca]OHR45258.1 hypothetical protein HMPREF3054_09760 [Neisseria sp. HMSC071B12]OHR45854.1 hypothetical protein HMPREF2753_06915 [Neisseria sp. HMSC071C03]